MAKSDNDARIRACVDSFVEQLSALVRQAALQSVQEALVAAGAPAPARRGRPRKKATAPARRASKKRGRRSSAAVSKTTDAALTFVKANPNCSVGEIGAGLGLTTKDLRLPLMKLLADGKLRTTGQKRGTRYHAGGGGRKKKAKRKAGRKKATRKKATRKKAARKKTARKKTGRKKPSRKKKR